jgi:uncharacterized protein YyaL (SSP411 family)
MNHSNQNHSNRLSQETSLYLLQHAHDPVDWYTWSPGVLEQARRDNKPIFLSIGYSACHWCHVMARESFADPATAQILNEHFVNIKVDREERPDLDKIYQNAFHLLNGQPGGWPLNVVLTPDDRVPFFAATYLAKETRNGFPGFAELMQRLADYYRTGEAEVRRQNSSLMQALRAGPSRHGRSGYALNVRPLEDSVEQFKQRFDAGHGGFDQAPKFPQPLALERLLRHYQHTRQHNDEADTRAGFIVKYTLEKMACGGVYDQLGGGFFRYAVDRQWHIPHFEKMLYDNAQLLSIYSQVWQATQSETCKRIATEIAAWALRDMQAPEGGFYTSLDADSEGGEGGFYLWTEDQIKAVLSAGEFAVCQSYFGLHEADNFAGRRHLHIAAPLQNEQQQSLLAGAREKLLAARGQRPRPARDEKILTSWNALMIKALAIAGRHLQRPDLIGHADRALDFIRRELWRHERLLAVYNNGEAKFPAYLDDHVLLIDALLELLQCRWRADDMDFALKLGQVLLQRFQDPGKQGGFYFTGDDHEALIQRPKPIFDDALPGGNGIAAQVLIKLGHLTNSITHLVAAERALKNAWPSVERSPTGCAGVLLALEEYYFPSQIVVIRGSADDIETWRRHCSRAYAPRRLTLAIPDDATGLPEFLAQRTARQSTLAYVCSGSKCSAPINDLDQLLQLLENNEIPALGSNLRMPGRITH